MFVFVWWPFDNNIINGICSNCNIMSIWRCYKSIKRNTFLSVKIFLLLTNLLLSVGLWPVIAPPKNDFIEILSSDYQFHFIPILLSYNFSNMIHNLSNIPDCIHCWYRLWHVELEPYSLGNIFPLTTSSQHKYYTIKHFFRE